MASAVGDQIDDLQVTVTNGTFVDTLAVVTGTATQEAIVQNIFSTGQIQLEWFDGSAEIVFDTSVAATASAYLNMTFRVSNTTKRRVRIKNISGSTQQIGWSGVLSHT